MAKKQKPPTIDSLNPELALLVKLGSIAVHADEFMSPGVHEVDGYALRQLLLDPDVIEWIDEITKSALLPVKRNR